MKSDDSQLYRPVKPPMNDQEFRNYLDSDGHMVKQEEFRLSIYQGGVEPSLRRVVWRHLLNIYPEDMSGRERFEYMKRKENEYFELRDNWKDMFSKREVSDEAKHVASLVKKDVLRTDRTHKFYAGGDESKNLISLYNILVTYALAHPEVSYCQGMSDIASPLLVVQKEEAQAYLCFCGLMNRLRSNFLYNGEAITTKLQHLSALVHFYDPVFHVYMKEHGAEDLFFCYRWLLLEMKREFPFEDALYMLEVMWSTLPPAPPVVSLQLKDPDYFPSLLLALSPHSPTGALKQTQYSHLLAKRRISIPASKDITGPKSPKVLVSPKFREALLKEAETDKKLADILEAPKDSTDGCEVMSDLCSLNNKVDSVSTDSKAEAANVDSEINKTDAIEISKNSVSEVNKKDNANTDEVQGKTDSTSSKELCQNNDVDSAAGKPLKSEISSKDSNGNDSNDSNDSPKSESDRCVSCSNSDGSRSNSDPEKNCGESKVSNSNSNSNYTTSNGNSKDDSPDKFESANTSMASSLSNSYSVERFPSLISGCSLDDERISFMDSEVEVISSSEKVDEPGCSVPETCDTDEQSQFHLSLERAESDNLKKKSTIPQIKGSFFSGMKKILSSPKRRPGKAMKVNGNGNVIGENGTENSAVRSQSCHNFGSAKSTAGKDMNRNATSMVMGISPENDNIEHTLFEINLPMSKTAEKDQDSGNGSLTSSTNSSHVPVSRLKPGNEKAKLKLDISKGNGNVKEKNVRNKKMDLKKDFEDTEASMVALKRVIDEIPEDKYPVFCENHFNMDNGDSNRTDEAKEEGVVCECMEVVDTSEDEVSRLKQLPSPELFGYGNPFLMFICLTVLLQHREMVIKAGMEYDELAMYFDKMVRKHNVHKVLHQARQLYTDYIRMQQSAINETKAEPDFSV